MTDNQPYPECLRRPDAGGHIQTRTTQTEARYRRRFSGMIRTLCKQKGWVSADAVELASALSECSGHYAANTLKQYSGAIRQRLRDLWDHGTITQQEIEMIDAQLCAYEPAKRSGKLRRKQTSAHRAKSVRPEQIAAIAMVLLRHPTPIRQIAAGLLEHGVDLVTRPGEFLTIKPDAQDRFWVKSAKFSEANLKGLRAARIVPTDHYDAGEIAELKTISELIFTERAKGATTQSLLRRCQRAIRQARKEVGGRSSRIVAYTVRHQGRANLVAMGMATDEVAVVMGHASAGTAQSHYAPARRAWRGMAGLTPPTVNAALLAKVRPANPTRGWDATRTQVQNHDAKLR